MAIDKKAQMMVPDFFKPVLKEATKSITKPQKGDDVLFLDMADSDAWKLLKGIVDGLKNSIEEQCKQMAGKATTWEEVAKIYYGKDVAIDSMDSVINIIELRKKADDIEKSLNK